MSNRYSMGSGKQIAIHLPVNGVAGLGLVGAIAFAGLIGGPLWAGLMVAVGLVTVSLWGQYQRGLDERLRLQDSFAHQLLQGANPEDIAQLMLAGGMAEKSAFEFLEAIKQEFGGEAFKGDLRTPAPGQLDPVSPGISLTLSHDLGVWYAKLQFSGETSKQFLKGGLSQWKARGNTPQEAVDNVLRRCSQARQQVVIHDYAARMVAESDH